jgi:hypothetical protein
MSPRFVDCARSDCDWKDYEMTGAAGSKLLKALSRRKPNSGDYSYNLVHTKFMRRGGLRGARLRINARSEAALRIIPGCRTGVKPEASNFGEHHAWAPARDCAAMLQRWKKTIKGSTTSADAAAQRSKVRAKTRMR